MSDPTPLPTNLPGTLTLDQTKAAVEAFGYQLAMVPKPPATPPPGFAAPESSVS